MDSPLLELRLPDDLPAGAGVQALGATLSGLGVGDEASRRAMAVVGELIAEARQREVFDDATSPVLLRVDRHGDRLSITVNDRRALETHAVAAQRLSWQLARLGLVEDLRSWSDEHGNSTQCEIALVSDAERPVSPVEDMALVDDEVAARVVVRPATAADAEGISRLAFRTVGYTHIDAGLYSPEGLRRRLEGGSLISFVAEAPDDEIVGHIALMPDEENRVPELGRLMVDPRWRGRKLSTPLGAASLQGAREIGYPFVWSECTARHTIAQGAALAKGGVEVGFLIGAGPDAISLAGFEHKTTGRASLVPYAIPVRRGPQRTVYLPERHWAVYRDLVGRLGLDRELVDPQAFTATGPSVIHVGVHPGYSAGRISIQRMGADAIQRTADEYLAMAASGLAVVYIDFDLHDPSAAEAIRIAESNGFFWAALIPEAREGGDVLRLQRVGWVGVDTESSEFASDFGRQMAEFVQAERRRAEAPAGLR